MNIDFSLQALGSTLKQHAKLNKIII